MEKSLTSGFAEDSVGRWSRTEAPDVADREQRTDGPVIAEDNMVKVWKIAPGDKAKAWRMCREQGCIVIGFMQTDFSTLDDAALRKALEKSRKGTNEEGKSPKNAANQIRNFVHEIQLSDVVVANKGLSGVVGIGVVTSEYLPPQSPRNPSKDDWYTHARLVDWQITQSIDGLDRYFFVQDTVKLLRPEQCDMIKQKYLEKYPADAELKAKLDRLFNGTPGVIMEQLLEQFRQIIAYGPPGTGKTRAAKRVALALLSRKKPKEDSTEDEIDKQLKPYRDADQFALVVFHPAYEYEQFVGGIEPKEFEGKVAFHTKPGVFLKLCRKAEQNQERCVLIIDEINRGSLPKLLGELVYALEYRGHEVSLPFTCEGRDKLIVPKNLYVIATMNSADRSIGHIDVAIRRRFALFPLGPNPDVVQHVWREIGDESYGNRLARLMDELNAKLKQGNDSNAEMEMGVGHSYFLPTPGSSLEDAKEQVGRKWTYQVQPLLREYEQLLNRGTELEKYFKYSLGSLLAPS
ncbi:MAG: AAA family ATPase [Gemmataceae bacterium]